MSFWCFSLVVVRLGRRFLLVKEQKHGQSWYLPAGRVEQGESFEMGACREVYEEAGIQVTLDGIIRIELAPPLHHRHYRQRVIFTAFPNDDTAPRNFPNSETLEARWVTIEEAKHLNLRGNEVLDILQYVQSGKAIYPLSILTMEGLPFS